LKTITTLFLSVVFSVASLSAALLTSAPGGGTTTTFAGGGDCFSGPSSGTVSGFAVSATSDSCYNYSSGWGFGPNGFSSLSIIGDNSATTAITIDLGGLHSFVGGFLNYAPGYGTPVISALAADGTTVLESYDLAALAPIVTPGGSDAGAYRGISRGSADIGFFRIQGSYVAMHDLNLGETAAVPEPSTALLFAGSALALLARRLRSVS
jgi:hypothetical protein